MNKIELKGRLKEIERVVDYMLNDRLMDMCFDKSIDDTYIKGIEASRTGIDQGIDALRWVINTIETDIDIDEEDKAKTKRDDKDRVNTLGLGEEIETIRHNGREYRLTHFYNDKPAYLFSIIRDNDRQDYGYNFHQGQTDLKVAIGEYIKKQEGEA